MLGGEQVAQTPVQLSGPFGRPLDAGGHITINQMYVEYMIPLRNYGAPIVMLHGATLSGKTYDTTPDGRIGWYEYFVRQGHATYIPDQVGRARSGVDMSLYNDVRAGLRPPSDLPNVYRGSDEGNWTNFRFGPVYGTLFPDSQFSVEAALELSKQAVPDLSGLLSNPNPNIRAMSDLAIMLEGAVLMGHSQTGSVPLSAALINPEAVKGMILVEPGFVLTQWNDEQLRILASIPMLIVFGDYLDNPTGISGFSWRNSYVQGMELVTRIQAIQGRAEMLYAPDHGIRGNSHMIMQDMNNLQIADLILDWMERNHLR